MECDVTCRMLDIRIHKQLDIRIRTAAAAVVAAAAAAAGYRSSRWRSSRIRKLKEIVVKSRENHLEI